MKLHQSDARWALPILACLLFCTWDVPSQGQFDFVSGEPNLGYFKAAGLMYDGNFGDALEVFRDNARLGPRTIDGGWIDSVCYRTMAGECLYAMGNLEQALDHYNAALALIVADSRWMDRVEFPVALGPAQGGNRIPVPWAPADRAVLPGDFSTGMKVLVGRLDNSEVARRGGVVAPPEYRLLNVAEVVRCLSLAFMRRTEILGPLCAHDPLSEALLNALEDRGAPRNQWSQAWHDVQYGLSLAGVGRNGDAAIALQRSVTLGGNYTHPASAIALMELGRLMASEHRYEQAEQFYLQASVAAAEFSQFNQVGLVEEALHRATVMHIFRHSAQPLPELALALDWARRQRLRHLTASLLVDSAENLIVLGRNAEAEALIAEARRARGRKSSLSVQLSARLEHQAALLAFQARQLAPAQAALKAALDWQRAASPRLFQIATTSQWYLTNANSLSSRTAADLFQDLLHDPQPDDWIQDTLDTLAVQTSRLGPSLEHWLELSLERGEFEKAFEVAERLRRDRFYSAFPLGGRWLSLRWMLEAPEWNLNEEGLQRRRDVLTRYPEYAAIAARARELRTRIAEDLTQRKKRTPPATSDQEASPPEGLSSALDELNRWSQLQEAMLGELALRREVVPYLFPARTDVQSLQKALGKRRAALIFTSTSRGMLVFLISQEGMFQWRLADDARLQRSVKDLLRSIGVVNDKSVIDEKVLTDSKWREMARSLLSGIVDRAQFGFWKRYDQVIIVPDSYLWYLPFEILLWEDVDDSSAGNAGDRPCISYAPSAGLIATRSGNRPRFPFTVVAVGNGYSRAEAETLPDRLEELTSVVERVVPLPKKLVAPSGLLRCFWDRLVVWDDIPDARDNPLEWAPARVDSGRPEASIARWMQLPFGGPRQVLLPGFRSGAEASGRALGNGSDMYQTVMSLMASGAQTVLISRWRTGGQSSFDLVRDYLQEADDLGPAAAWNRSVQILRESTLDPAWEPRLNLGRTTEVVSAEHPFFWASVAVVTQQLQELSETSRQAETLQPPPVVEP